MSSTSTATGCSRATSGTNPESGPDRGNSKGSPQGAESVSRSNLDIAPADGLVTLTEFTDDVFVRAGGPCLSLEALGVGESFAGSASVRERRLNCSPGWMETATEARLEGTGRTAPALARIDFDSDGAAASLAELRTAVATTRKSRPGRRPPSNSAAGRVRRAFRRGQPSPWCRLLDQYDRPGADASGNALSADDKLSRAELSLSPEALRGSM